MTHPSPHASLYGPSQGCTPQPGQCTRSVQGQHSREPRRIWIYNKYRDTIKVWPDCMGLFCILQALHHYFKHTQTLAFHGLCLSVFLHCLLLRLACSKKGNHHAVRSLVVFYLERLFVVVKCLHDIHGPARNTHTVCLVLELAWQCTGCEHSGTQLIDIVIECYTTSGPLAVFHCRIEPDGLLLQLWQRT